MSADIIDHVEIPVADAQRAYHFYEATLSPLKLELIISIQAHGGGARHGFGRDGYPRLWIHEEKGERLPVHIAFAAQNRATVDAFFSAALSNGGTDNGSPGVREKYHSSYYAAYVLDPDGNNVEAVYQGRP